MTKEEVVLLDLDGVILDTEYIVAQLKKQMIDLSWNNFFEQLNWTQILEQANEINDSIKIIKELQSIKDNIKILTKIHTLYEMQAKVIELRNRGITIPILFVPPHIKKSQIYTPSNNTLIDDSLKNILDWNVNGGKGILFDGGKGILFDENFEEKRHTLDIPKVKSLEFLLRR